MKKLTALVLVFATVFAFAACGKNTGTETETAKPTPVAEQNYLSATDDDFDYLVQVVRGIIFSAPVTTPGLPKWGSTHELAEYVRNCTPEDYKDAYYYDSSSDTALGDAMYMIFNTGSMGLFNHLDIPVEEEVFHRYRDYDETGETCAFPPDPENMFTDDFGYLKINADHVDFILKNVLCIEPDRTKTDEDFDYSRYRGIFNYYYCDGYYYYQYDEGGGGYYLSDTVDYTQQADGSYIVKLSSYNEIDVIDPHTGEPDEDYVYTIFEVSAALKEIDGKRIWAVSYIKPAEYVLNVRVK